jgi:hypothetical protein
MQPSRRRRATTAALVLLLALVAGCGGGGGSGTSVRIIFGDGAADHGAADSAIDGHAEAGPDVSTAGHCCALELGDGSTVLCAALDMDAAPGLVEACLPQNSHGAYGRWTCGTGAEPPVCGNNGLSCGLGDPCTLVDVGCPGVVQSCDFKPYTPPPG